MQTTVLSSTAAAHPASLQTNLGAAVPQMLTTIGNVDILQRSLLGNFSSTKCPGNVIIKTYDLARTLRNAGVAVVGGFHSPMERECLTLLLRGTQPIVICPARGIHNLRVPTAWKPALKSERLLVVSPFPEAANRVTAGLALQRNRFVAALADTIVVTYAAAGSQTETFAREVRSWQKVCYTLDGPETQPLLQIGFRGISPGEWPPAA